MTAQTLAPLAVRERHVREPRAVLLDVRSPAEFEAAHIVGSRNVALATLDPTALAAGDVTYETPVTVVCFSGARARTAAERLVQAGFSDVVVLERGLQGWSAAGLPVQKGAGGAISLERQVRITAGSLVVLGVVLAAAVSPYAILLSAFVGAGLVFSGVTDTCGMGLLLARAPWNTRVGAATRSPDTTSA